jgi:hypothetical protein
VRFQQRRVGEAEALADQVLSEARARSDPWATAMMLLLSASVRLWTGRTGEAVALAERALSTFTGLGDPYGTLQASAVLGRSLVMVGRVDEGFTLLARASEDGVEGTATRRDEARIVRFTRLAAALQVGDVERGLPLLAELEDLAGSGIGGADPAVALAMSALQEGDGRRAQEHLASHVGDGTPSVEAVASLVAAVAGTGGAAQHADRVDRADDATYLDRAMGSLGAALEASAGDHGAPEAQRRISLARSAVHGTEDQVAKAVVELGAAAVAARLGLPEADEVADHAGLLLARLGIGADGWRRAFALATRTAPR